MHMSDIRDQVEQLGGPKLKAEDLATATNLSIGAIGRRLRGDWDESDLAVDARRRLDPSEPSWTPTEAIAIARHSRVSPARLLVLRGVLTEAEVVLAAAEISVPIPELMEAAEAVMGKPQLVPQSGFTLEELEEVVAKLRGRY